LVLGERGVECVAGGRGIAHFYRECGVWNAPASPEYRRISGHPTSAPHFADPACVMLRPVPALR
jgi:hypothetical protein